MTFAADDLADGQEESLPPKRRMRRPRLVLVVGLWMLCFPTFVVSIVVAADILLNYRTRSNFLIFWVTAGTLLLTGSILYHITRNYFTLPAARKDLSGDFTDNPDRERTKEVQEHDSSAE
jgi:hypothetical protein